jgi:hypothetical protein
MLAIASQTAPLLTFAASASGSPTARPRLDGVDFASGPASS